MRGVAQLAAKWQLHVVVCDSGMMEHLLHTNRVAALAVTSPVGGRKIWTLATFLIQIFKTVCDSLISKSEIYVARSLFEALCVREGELCLPDSFLQLSEIKTHLFFESFLP